MQLLATLVFVGTASAHIPLVAGRSSAFLALKGVMQRQVDSSFCSAGYYCTDAGCCPDEYSVEECGATATLSVIPPPAKEEPSTSTNPLEPTATDKATSEAEPITSEAEPTTSEAEPITSTDALSVITTNAISTTTPASNSIIATTSLPPHATVAGAGRNAQFRVLAAIGGLGAILMVV
ncbi:hypothetical protein FALCPG4_015048 [Fusarium falciforme]